AAARDAGSRAKMAVLSNDSSIDPVGACVGMRGSRVQAVVAELQGEKIDIIQWNNDEPTFIVNALAPAEVSKVVLDEEADRVEVVVPDEQLSLAIGRRGQNVRLASQLTGWQIDIITESQDSERRQREFSERTALFQEALDVDEVIAQLLVTEGFATVEDLAFVEPYEISDIEGFDEETAEELQARARDFLDRQAAILDAKRVELGVEDGVMAVPGVTGAIAVALGEGGVKTVEDLADLATDEIRGGYEVKNGERVKVPGVLESFNLAQEEAEMLILQARVAAGWIDASELPQPPEPEYEEELPEGEYDAEAVFAAAPEGEEVEAVEGDDDAKLVTHEVMDESRLIRFVAAPDGSVAPDLARKLPGRGLWVAADRASIETAVKKNLFSRAAKAPMKPAADLADTVESLLAKRCLDQLGLARREGVLISGFEKSLANVRSGKAAWIIEAADGSADGRGKLLSPWAGKCDTRRPA
ncbi:RNA-binding protein, partial [Brevundimonas sp. Root1423]|uniref:RNA-binding protein n=1 Tax=Brevundimonas sp. Root1423 TaxID=1736462 RepID=UPI001F196569